MPENAGIIDAEGLAVPRWVVLIPLGVIKPVLEEIGDRFADHCFADRFESSLITGVAAVIIGCAANDK